jgi:hypothetical protein
VVDQAARVHEGVEGFLNLLLNRGRRPAQAVPEWRQRLDAALLRPVSVSYEQASLASIAADLGKRLGAPVLVSPNAAIDDPLTFALVDVPVRDAVAWVARLTGLELVVSDGAVRLVDSPPTVCRCYPLGDLLSGPLDGDGDLDVVQELIQTSTGWHDMYVAGSSLTIFDDLLVVSQSEPAHLQIEEVLSALRRVFEKQ